MTDEYPLIKLTGKKASGLIVPEALNESNNEFV